MTKKTFDPIYISTAIASLLLCSLCLVLPVVQWSSIPDDTIIKVCAGLAALAIGICKITFIPLAIGHFTRSFYVPAVTLFILSIACLSVSTITSRDFLNRISDTQSKQETLTNTSYLNRQSIIEELNGEIKNLNALISADTNSNFRGRAYLNIERVNTLRREREAITKESESLYAALNASVRNDFGQDIVIPMGARSVRLSAAAGVSILLHLSCVFSVLAITVWRADIPAIGSTKNRKTKKRVNIKTENKREAKQDAYKQDDKSRIQRSDLTQMQFDLYGRIFSGEFGDTPVIREIIKKKIIPGGFNKIRPVFDLLIDDKHMVETANGFELIQKTLINEKGEENEN